MSKKTTLLWRGGSAVLAVLLVISLFGTRCALNYTGTLNSYLGTTTSRIVTPDGVSEGDTVYYKSEYGDYSAENLQLLIQDTYDESVLEQEEGSVLLRNENGALPLASSSRVTLFGHAWVQPVYAPGGANSGAANTGTYVVTPYDALKSAGFAVNETLYSAYQNSSTARVASNNLQFPGGPNASDDTMPPPELGEEPASFYTQALKDSWAQDYNDAAIVMLAREGGEGTEMMMDDPEGISALALHKDERDMLKMINDSGVFGKIVVLLNSAYPMEVEWLKEYNVDACLWVGDPGQRGFEGVANLLTGKANPSGHLTDTYAVDSLSSPAAHVSSQNLTKWENVDEVLNSGIVTDKPINVQNVVVQSEGIYVGYKYYETRYEDSVLNPSSGAASGVGAVGNAWRYQNEVSYPFGFGLSYTTFDQTLDSVTYDEANDLFTAQVTVKNTGSVAGKSVVQLYVQTPYGDYERENLVEKSAVQVIGYGKTDTLQPGATQQLEITADRYLMASYDYQNVKGYILSAGDYYLAIGDDAHDALNNILAAKGASGLVDHNGQAVSGNGAKTYHWSYDALDSESYRYSDTGTEVTNQFDDCDANYWQEGAVTYLTRQDWQGTFPTTPVTMTCTEEMMYILQGELYEKPADAPSVSSFTQGANNDLTFVMMKDVPYDDDATWDKYLDQMTIEEMASQLADMFGTTEVTSVGRPAFTEGDGTASVGANTFPEEYGDTRDVCLYPCPTVAAATWSQERLTRRGELMAEEALYCKLPAFWTGGGNLHRTPFGGRNGEYYSEDSILTYLDTVVQLTPIQERGVSPGIKHLAGNDQELHREGLVMFFNEQAFREGALKGFEGALTQDRTLALMQSFNRLGLTWSSSSPALCTQVVRNEWGFKGQEETDGVAGGTFKCHFPDSLTAGTTTYCIDPTGSSTQGILQAIRENDDGNLVQWLRSAVKHYHYMLSRTNLINGLSEQARIESVMPWWETSLYALDGVLALLTVGGIVMLARAQRGAKKSSVTVEQPVDSHK